MNLQENINRIHQMMGINESNFFKRRINDEEINKEFNVSLDYVTHMFNWMLEINEVSFNEFKTLFMVNAMNGFISKLTDEGLNKREYYEVYDFILNHFEPKLEERYNEIVKDKSTDL